MRSLLAAGALLLPALFLLYFSRNALMLVALLVLILPAGYAVWRLLWRRYGAPAEPLTGLLLAPPLALAALLVINLAGALLTAPGTMLFAGMLPLTLAGLLWLADDLTLCRRPLLRWLRGRLPWLLAAAVLILAGNWTSALPNRFLGGADDGAYTSTIYSFYLRGGIAWQVPLAAELREAVAPERLLPISYVPAPERPGLAVPIHPLGFPLMAAPLYEAALWLRVPWDDAVFLPYQLCGLLSLLFMLALGRELAGGAGALLAVVLLQWNWLQGWLARSALGEVPLQALGLAVLWLLVRARRYPDQRWLPAAALLAAAAVTIKIEGIILLVLIAPLALAPAAGSARRWRSALWLCGLPALLWAIYLLVHPGFIARYIANNIMPVLARYFPMLPGMS